MSFLHTVLLLRRAGILSVPCCPGYLQGAVAARFVLTARSDPGGPCAFTHGLLKSMAVGLRQLCSPGGVFFSSIAQHFNDFSVVLFTKEENHSFAPSAAKCSPKPEPQPLHPSAWREALCKCKAFFQLQLLPAVLVDGLGELTPYLDRDNSRWSPVMQGLI